MSEPWGGPDDVCPRCQSADWMPADEGAFAACNDCGFVQYDMYTLQIMAEVVREQKACNAEAKKRGLAE